MFQAQARPLFRVFFLVQYQFSADPDLVLRHGGGVAVNRGATRAVEAPEDEITFISLANEVVAIPRALNLSYALLSAFTYKFNLATSLQLSHIDYLF